MQPSFRKTCPTAILSQQHSPSGWGLGRFSPARVHLFFLKDCFKKLSDYVCAGVCEWMWVPTKARQRCQFPWSGDSRRLWAVWPGCWELNSDPFWDNTHASWLDHLSTCSEELFMQGGLLFLLTLPFSQDLSSLSESHLYHRKLHSVCVWGGSHP